MTPRHTGANTCGDAGYPFVGPTLHIEQPLVRLLVLASPRQLGLHLGNRSSELTSFGFGLASGRHGTSEVTTKLLDLRTRISHARNLAAQQHGVVCV